MEHIRGITMDMPTKAMSVVKPRPGKPLYIVVRDLIRDAVQDGTFQAGQRLPSTKDLARQMGVSLVTAHRALQELVNDGLLQRTQGRGTFVHERYEERRQAAATMRLGLIVHEGAVLECFYRCMVFSGIQQATHQLGADLLVLGYAEDVRNECDGLILFESPLHQIAAAAQRAGRRPIVSIGTHCPTGMVSCIEIDNVEMGRSAVRHLCDLGHRSLGFMGPDDHMTFGRDRWAGFLAACQQQEVAPREQNVIRSLGCRLDERERMALIRALSSPNRPTAIFAAGYDFVLDVLDAAKTVGLVVPRDLSVITVDDTPSAPYLDPPLTTFRQPLLELGHAAINMLLERTRQPGERPQHRTLHPELVIRGSTGPAPY